MDEETTTPAGDDTAVTPEVATPETTEATPETPETPAAEEETPAA